MFWFKMNPDDQIKAAASLNSWPGIWTTDLLQIPSWWAIRSGSLSSFIHKRSGGLRLLRRGLGLVLFSWDYSWCLDCSGWQIPWSLWCPGSTDLLHHILWHLHRWTIFVGALETLYGPRRALCLEYARHCTAPLWVLGLQHSADF